MIVVKIKGGIGNQMFQYAFGRMLANKYKMKMLLDITWYSTGDREFVLDKLNTIYFQKIKNSLLMKLVRLILRPKIIKEEEPFKEIEIKNGDNIILEGYWYAYTMYLDKEIKNIYREFTLRKPSEKFLKEYRRLNSKNSISIHVRRGDILSPTNQTTVQNRNYYLEGLDIIIKEAKIQKPKVTIFSDDTDWCIDNLSQIENVEISILNSKKMTDLEELIFMSKHSYNIISSSTFSWWAAILNQNKDKIVITPKSWCEGERENELVLKYLVQPSWKIV